MALKDAPTDPHRDMVDRTLIERSAVYHAPFGDQVTRYQDLRDETKKLLGKIMAYCPPCVERSLAVSRIREGCMWANAAIACNEVAPAASEKTD